MDSISKFIIIDKIAFEKANTNQINDRLSKASSIFKSIIKNCFTKFKFKQKQLEQVIRIIINNFHINTGDIFKPVIHSFTQSLLEFLNNQYFFDNLQRKTHQDIIDVTIKSLRDLTTQLSNDDNLISSLFDILLIFWFPKNTSSLNLITNTNSYHSNLFKIILTYCDFIFSETKKERGSLIKVFKLINCSIIYLSNSDIKRCHMLTKLGITFILEVKSITFPNLIKEISLFLNISSIFISCHKLPKLLGDNWNIGERGQLISLSSSDQAYTSEIEVNATILGSSQGSFNEIPDSESNDISYDDSTSKRDMDPVYSKFLNSISKCIEIIIDLSINNPNSSNLPIDSLNLFISPNFDNYGWFTNRYLSLNSETHSIPWLLRYGLVNLLIAYYDLKNSLGVDNAQIGETGIKRRKIINHLNQYDSLVNILLSESTPFQFLITMIELNKSESLTVTLLQCLSIYISHCSSNSNTINSYAAIEYIINPKNNTLGKIINMFELNNGNYTNWILLTLNLTYNIMNDFKSNDFIQANKSVHLDKMLKYCIEFLKNPKLCKLSSRLLISIFDSHEENLNLNDTIIQQFDNMIDLSEISGPSELSFESNLLWISLLKMGKNYKFKSLNFQSSTNESNDQLYSHKLVNWLLSKDFNQLRNSNDIFSTCQMIFWLLNKKSFTISTDLFEFNQIYKGDLSDIDYMFHSQSKLTTSAFLQRIPKKSFKLAINNKKIEVDQGPIHISNKDLNKLENRFKFFIYNLVDLNFSHKIAKWSLGICIFIGKSNIKLFVDLFDKVKRYDQFELNEFYVAFIDFITRINSNNVEWISKIVHLIRAPKLLENVYYILNSKKAKKFQIVNDFESQIMDEFIPNRDESNNNGGFDDDDSEIFNPDKYNWKMQFSKLNEQKLINSLMIVNSIENDINLCISKVFKLKWNNEGSQLAVASQLLMFFEEKGIIGINISSVDLIVNNLTQLLQNNSIMKFEMMISICCKMLSIFCPIWIKSKNENLISDAFNIYSYFKSLNSKDLFHTNDVIVNFLDFTISILSNAPSDSPFNKQDLLSISTNLFNSMTNFNRYRIFKSILGLLQHQKTDEQLQYYEYFTKSFQNAYSSSEDSVTFNLYMGEIANASDTLLIATICNLIEFSDFKQMKLYFCYFIDSIDLDIEKLFWNLKLVFFKQFLSFGKDLLDFPYDLFGFKSNFDFLLKNNKDLTSLALINNSTVEISKISTISNIKTDNLLKDSVPIILSFGEIGLNSLQENYPKFSKSIKSILKDQLPLVIYQILIKCNVSNEFELFEIDKDKLMDDMISPYTNVNSNIEFLKEYEIFQSPRKCNLLIHSFMTQSGVKSWNICLVYYLCTKLLFLIENSTLEIEKEINIRRVKFLYMKCPELFKTPQINSLIIGNLSKYLLTDKLRDDVCQLIICMINFGPDDSNENVLNIWIPLITLLLKCEHKSQVIRQLIQFIDKSSKDSIFNNFRFIINPCLAKLKGETVSIGFDSTIKIIECGFPIDKMKPIIELLPFLFNNNDDDIWDIEGHKNKLTPTLVQKLFEIQNKFNHLINDDVKLWIGNSLGKYYELTGNLPHLEVFEFNKTIFEKYSGDNFHLVAGVIDYIFELMIIELPNASLHSKLCFESITGVIIEKQKQSLADITGYISYDKLIKPFESYIQPMSNYTCSLSVSDFEITSQLYYKDNLSIVLNGFGTSILNSPFEEWIIKIIFAIINELNSQSSIFTLLTTYISQIPSFAIKCFCPLVIYFIQNNKDERNKFISNMMIELFDQDFKLISGESIKLFCELALLIRSGTKSNDKLNSKFINVYRRLNKPRIFMALEFIGKHKASCLLLEDYYMNSVNIEKDSWMNSTDVKKFMKVVYSGIGEPDLMMGLPVDPNLDYGLGIFENNGLKNGKLMFENGKLESNLKTMDKIPFDTMNKFSNDLISIGWTGVSKILGDKVNHLETGRDDDDYNDAENSIGDDLNYLKLWKLNQWDLPVSDKMTSENEIIYGVLKNVNDHGIDQSHGMFNKSIVSIVDNFTPMLKSKWLTKEDSLKSWMKSLSIVNNLNSISVSGDLIIQQQHYENDTKWFQHSDLETFENLLLSRQVIFEMLANRHGGHGSWDLEVNELHRFNKLMTMKNETQKSINTAVHLDRISKIPELGEDDLIQRISKFNLALAFWVEHSETAFPVSTLKMIIKESDQSNEKLSVPYMTAVLTQWLVESKQETPEDIMRGYIEPITDKLGGMGDLMDIGETYRIFAEFCDKQLRTNELNNSITNIRESLLKLQKDIQTLGKILKSGDGKDKHGLKQIARLKGIYGTKKIELSKLENERGNLVSKAIKFYLNSISFDDDGRGDNNNVDRFCALWMENNEIEIDIEELLQLPTFKFVPWNNQLTSRLMMGSNDFQMTLQKLVSNIAQWHPFQTLYMLKSLRINKLESKDATVQSRGEVCDSIWRLLMGKSKALNVQGFKDLLGDIDSICEKMVEVCVIKSSEKRAKSIDVGSLKSGKWWFRELPGMNFPSPVMTIPIKSNGSYKSTELVTILSVDRTIAIAPTGVSAPKIMKMNLSSGETQRMLLKSPDDLRQDAIMEQVFGKVNKLLMLDPSTRKREIQIRTYNVLPLGPQNGVIEFVSNSKSMMDIMYGLHGVEVITNARRELGDVEDDTNSVKLQVFQEICRTVPAKFRYFFFNNFISSDKWFESRLIYSHGLAVSSIIGYILGIGDRHCNNVLIDKRSGEPIHIDFGVVFDQGKLLPIPEGVPFRLTRELVDGLGVTGVNGVFSRSSEQVFRVLRGKMEHILDILDVLKYDPLYLWTLSPLRKRKLMVMYEDNNTGIEELIKKDSTSEASTAIEGVKTKLRGAGLRDDAIVRGLIREAMSVENLSQLFRGWSAFL